VCSLMAISESSGHGPREPTLPYLAASASHRGCWPFRFAAEPPGWRTTPHQAWRWPIRPWHDGLEMSVRLKRAWELARLAATYSWHTKEFARFLVAIHFKGNNGHFIA